MLKTLKRKEKGEGRDKMFAMASAKFEAASCSQEIEELNGLTQHLDILMEKVKSEDVEWRKLSQCIVELEEEYAKKKQAAEKQLAEQDAEIKAKEAEVHRLKAANKWGWGAMLGIAALTVVAVACVGLAVVATGGTAAAPILGALAGHAGVIGASWGGAGVAAAGIIYVSAQQITSQNSAIQQLEVSQEELRKKKAGYKAAQTSLENFREMQNSDFADLQFQCRTLQQRYSALLANLQLTDVAGKKVKAFMEFFRTTGADYADCLSLEDDDLLDEIDDAAIVEFEAKLKNLLTENETMEKNAIDAYTKFMDPSAKHV